MPPVPTTIGSSVSECQGPSQKILESERDTAVIKVVFRKRTLGEADKKPGYCSNSLGQRLWEFKPSQPTPLGPSVTEAIRDFPP